MAFPTAAATAGSSHPEAATQSARFPAGSASISS
jgi:hypothetical protein